MEDSKSEGYLNASLTARFALTLCFLKSPPCKPYLERSKHGEYREKKKKKRSEAWHLLQNMVFSVYKNRSTPNLNYERQIHHSWLFIICQECLPDHCSGQVKGLLRYHCLHCLISWQGWSTGISRSQLAGTTMNWEILILLWFFPKKTCSCAFLSFEYSVVKSNGSLGQRSRMKSDLKHGFKEGNARIYRLCLWWYRTETYNRSMPKVYIIK